MDMMEICVPFTDVSSLSPGPYLSRSFKRLGVPQLPRMELVTNGTHYSQTEIPNRNFPMIFWKWKTQIITVCGVSAGYTANGNNVPGIHIEINARLPLLCSFSFLSSEKYATVSETAHNHTSAVCPPWSSSSKRENYIVNTYPSSLTRPKSHNFNTTRICIGLVGLVFKHCDQQSSVDFL